MGEQGKVATVPIFSERHVVIDDNSVGQAKSVEVDGIDTVLVDRCIRVEEKFLNATWLFSKDGSS